ncbi:MAG TPA: LLM class F420-dependent oxidoreductase [Candidatus Dormibacteraeota bacterium]
MKFGVAIFPTDYAISMSELAPAAEQLGFESLWVAEHTHIPTSRESPWPAGGELPKHYWHTLDPFIALTAAALASKTIRVATGICLLTERDPMHAAKQAASVDLVSNGRFIFGIGAGWNREEMANHGTEFSTRWKLMRERAEAIKEIWTKDPAEYHGDMVDFGPIWSFPKPVQKPHPPIVLGGSGPRILERVVRYADGWMPNRGDVLERIPDLQRMAKDAGRDPIPVTYYPKATVEEIERCATAGIDRLIWYVPPDGRDAAMRRLDELGAMIGPYLKD